MYKLWGFPKLISWCSLLTVIVGVTVIAVRQYFHQAIDLATIYKAGGTGISVVGFLIWLLGQTSIFPWICRTFPWLGIPDINGDWDATLTSNWEAIAEIEKNGLKSLEQNLPLSEPKPGHAFITMRLFHVGMALSMLDNYSTSETIFSSVRRNTETGDTQLVYIYRNTTKVPRPTDSSHHYGSAILNVPRGGGVKQSLSGCYFTDRNWRQARNTAGVIELARSGGHAT